MRKLIFLLFVGFVWIQGANAECTSGWCPGASCNGKGCGNGVCEWNEDCHCCPADCGLCLKCNAVCGNLVCEEGENSCNCADDCGPCCVNGICDEVSGETHSNCPADCAVTIRGRVVDCEDHSRGLGNPSPSGITEVECHSEFHQFFANSDGGGYFQFDNVEPGDYKCTAQLAGYHDNSQGIHLAQGSRTEKKEFIIPLCPVRGSLGGTVKTFRDEAIVHSTVNCTDEHGMSHFRFSSPTGRFFFPQVPAGPLGTNYTCMSTKAGFSASDPVTVLVQRARLSQVELQQARFPATLKGIVIDTETNAGVETTLSVECRPIVGGGVVESTFTGNPNAGEWVYNSLIPGTYRCRSFKSGWETDSGEVVVPDGGEAFLRLETSRRPGHIFGSVNNNRTGELIGGVTVTCVAQGPGQTPDTHPTRESITNFGLQVAQLQGLYRIVGVIEGNYSCSASLDAAYFPSKAFTVIVQSGVFSFLDFTLEPRPGNIQGRVIEIDRNTKNDVALVPFAKVTCQEVQTGLFLEAFTRADSTDINEPNYIIEDMTSGNITCLCTAVGYTQDQTPVQELLPGATLTVDCRLEPLVGTIIGNIRDTQTGRNVIKGAMQCVGLPPLDYNERRPRSMDVPESPGPYVFEELRVGQYQCNASSLAYNPGVSPVVIIVGNDEVEVTIGVDPIPGIITGTVFDGNDPRAPPIAGARVTCSVPDSNGEAVVYEEPSTSFSGQYVFNNVLQFNQATCVADHPAYITAQAQGVVRRNQILTLDFAMDPIITSLSVAVFATDTGLAVVSSVRCVGQGFLSFIDITTPTGANPHVFEDLRLGTYECTASSDGYAPGTPTNVTISSAAQAGLRLGLSPFPATFTGEIRDLETQEILPGASVTCAVTPSVGDSKDFVIPTTGAGPWTIRDVDVFGSYRCECSRSGYLSDVHTGTVNPEDVINVPCVLEPKPCEMLGFVTDAVDAAGIEAANVNCENLDVGGQGQTLTNGQGRFQHFLRPPGLWRCTVDAENYEPRTIPRSSAPIAFRFDGSFTCAPAAINTLNYTLAPSPGFFSIRVIDGVSGDPVAGASVRCTRENGLPLEDNIPDPPTTLDDGISDFGAQKAKVPYECTATPPVQYFNAKVNFFLGVGETKQETIELFLKNP